MFLEQRSTGYLIEVINLENLYKPSVPQVTGRSHAGEEKQDLAIYQKQDLRFPSGEDLPQCWINPNYRVQQDNVVMAVSQR
ncbi:acetyltransferase [Spirulina sp. CS-785/01]|uniref:acetyltransferase n=1 Tax=Spirulina sp. CS-785/01 TaxID=3021716 RepID=UPI00232F00BB|nr:acetyltransferase [Spirulina sp. CS-785/01]MDB9313897.1 acetyltransferase [Spirulina sp. CS-785/01]